jgi:hypothetical protein
MHIRGHRHSSTTSAGRYSTWESATCFGRKKEPVQDSQSQEFFFRCFLSDRNCIGRTDEASSCIECSSERNHRTPPPDFGDLGQAPASKGVRPPMSSLVHVHTIVALEYRAHGSTRRGFYRMRALVGKEYYVTAMTICY